MKNKLNKIQSTPVSRRKKKRFKKAMRSIIQSAIKLKNLP